MARYWMLSIEVYQYWSIFWMSSFNRKPTRISLIGCLSWEDCLTDYRCFASHWGVFNNLRRFPHWCRREKRGFCSTVGRLHSLVCSYPKMRRSIFIVNVIEKIRMYWIRSCQKRSILPTSCFAWNSQLPIHSFRYFFHNYRSAVAHRQEGSISSFFSTFPRTKAIVEGPQVRAIQCPSQFLWEEEKLFTATRNFCWFSSCIIDLPNRIRLTPTASNGKTQIKTDFISNIDETMLFAINYNQIDGLYCVRFSDIHIWSLRNMKEFLSDHMQVFIIPPNDCSSNWSGFLIVESFHISTAYPHTHPNPYPYPHINRL